jgi:hypothetical protein
MVIKTQLHPAHGSLLIITTKHRIFITKQALLNAQAHPNFSLIQKVLEMSGNTNPGNFANRPKEEVQEIASKGGKASSHSGGTGNNNASNNPVCTAC